MHSKINFVTTPLTVRPPTGTNRYEPILLGAVLIYTGRRKSEARCVLNRSNGHSRFSIFVI